ncbi:MerR family transcriptional regulator [Sporosarcina sp. Te-1]|uniref:MerR family transcriptional regulator n=1 Tax=Sporosarcina sp. Te-1 TaxID=2818390 RepID=UPI001A9E4BB7|nr:MerR family transcriptional regulator [Sporosarcina sp. Te-1]QTD39792.1 MerR family transcriptional regulator [Sporosarcina sp. Te-1]
MYTVKEVAALLQLTEHTVRYYTDKGLVPRLKRDHRNNRQFNQASVNWLLCHLRHCGMPIENIKTYISLCLEGDATAEERYKIMRKQQAAALAQLAEAKQRAAYIEGKANHYFNLIHDMNSDAHRKGDQ